MELFESEVVQGRGSRTTIWLYRKSDAWVPVVDHPGAQVEKVASGPGTVWERRVTLRLAEGTRLIRQYSAPGDREPRDPLAYLEREVKRPPRRAQRKEYLVARRGRLVPVEGG